MPSSRKAPQALLHALVLALAATGADGSGQVEWFRGVAGESCDQTCAAVQDRPGKATCYEPALTAASKPGWGEADFLGLLPRLNPPMTADGAGSAGCGAGYGNIDDEWYSYIYEPEDVTWLPGQMQTSGRCGWSDWNMKPPTNGPGSDCASSLPDLIRFIMNPYNLLVTITTGQNQRNSKLTQQTVY